MSYGRRVLLILICTIMVAGCTGSAQVSAVTQPTLAPAPPDSAATSIGSEPTAVPSATAAEVLEDDQGLQQVIIAVATIPRGTPVRELIDAPAAYLSAQAVPADSRDAGAIRTVLELYEIDGMFLTADVLPGEQLRRSGLSDSRPIIDASTPTPISPPAPAELPADDQEQQAVLVAVATIPRGTLVAELIEAPTVYFAEQTKPIGSISFGAIGAIGTLAELQELDGMVVAADITRTNQLLRSHFTDPSSFIDTSGFDYEVPSGHDVRVLDLSPIQALGGNIVRGDKINVLGAAVTPDGYEHWPVFLMSVEVLDVESYPRFPDPEDVPDFDAWLLEYEGPDGYVITLAVQPDEAAELDTALEESTPIRLTFNSGSRGNQGTMIALPYLQALGGDVRRGDVVDVVTLAGSDDPSSESVIVASDVEVLAVYLPVDSLALSDDPALGNDGQLEYHVMLSVSFEDFPAFAVAAENGELALERP